MSDSNVPIPYTLTPRAVEALARRESRPLLRVYDQRTALLLPGEPSPGLVLAIGDEPTHAVQARADDLGIWHHVPEGDERADMTVYLVTVR